MLVRVSRLTVAVTLVGCALSVADRSAIAQATSAKSPVTRQAAITSAISRSPQATLAAADTASATANVLVARQFENPILGTSFTQSAPQQHFTLDIPLDPWWIRSPRVAAADAARAASRFRFAFATRSIGFNADTAYTRAQLTVARSRLSARTSRDADSLLVLARVRRDAGDASELDVELAAVFAGQSRNAASADSVATQSAALTLQTIMGISTDSAHIVVTDSLMLETPESTPLSSAAVTPLLVDAASRDVAAAESRVLTERRRRFGAPSLSVGFENINPGGPNGPLASAGVSFPLPLFNRNGAAVLSARAELLRAEAQLALTRLSTSAAVVATTRDAEAARARALRSTQLVASADRIAALSLLAYREGASTLMLVLEAQRAARETLGQYFDDVAASRTATSLLRLLTTLAPDSRP